MSAAFPRVPRTAGSRSTSSLALLAAVALVAAGIPHAHGGQRAVPAASSSEVLGRAVHVTVRGGDDRPVAGVTVRLRSAVTGRAEGMAATDVVGVTVFRNVPTGHYVAEALSGGERVLATSPLFEIAAGEVVVTTIRLPSKPGGMAALFGSVAAAAISAATALGVTAAAPTGQPVSPRR